MPRITWNVRHNIYPARIFRQIMLLARRLSVHSFVVHAIRAFLARLAHPIVLSAPPQIYAVGADGGHRLDKTFRPLSMGDAVIADSANDGRKRFAYRPPMVGQKEQF